MGRGLIGGRRRIPPFFRGHYRLAAAEIRVMTEAGDTPGATRERPRTGLLSVEGSFESGLVRYFPLESDVELGVEHYDIRVTVATF